MDNITQWIIWWALFTLSTKKYTIKNFLLWWLIANIPDSDIFIAKLLYTDPLDQFFFHRGVMHSIIGWLGIGVITWIIVSLLKSWKLLWEKVLNIIWSCIITIFGGHLIIDWLTTYGMRRFLPWSNRVSSWDIIFVVDFWMRVGLLILFVSYIISRSRKFISLSILWFVCIYLCACWLFKYTSYQHITRAFGLHYDSASIKRVIIVPEPLQPFLRRWVIQTSWWIYQTWYSVFDNVEPTNFIYAPWESIASYDLSTIPHLNQVYDFSRWFLLKQTNSWNIVFNNYLFGYYWWWMSWSQQTMFWFTLSWDALIQVSSHRVLTTGVWTRFRKRVWGELLLK